MCGIVGAIAHRDVVPLLVDGLKRLEYRGYDSAGIAVVETDRVRRVRRTGWQGLTQPLKSFRDRKVDFKKVALAVGGKKASFVNGNRNLTHLSW